MATASTSVCMVQGHTYGLARVTNCTRGAACPYKLRGLCCFFHEESAEEVQHDVLCLRVVSSPEGQIVERIQDLIDALQVVVEPSRWSRRRECSNAPMPRWRRSSQPFQCGLFFPVAHVTEMIVDFPAPQLAEQTVDQGGRVPHVTGEHVESVLFIPHERIHRIVGEVGDVPVPQEQIVEVFKVLPQQRDLRRIVSKAPVPQVTEAIVEAVPLVPSERTRFGAGCGFLRAADSVEQSGNNSACACARARTFCGANRGSLVPRIMVRRYGCRNASWSRSSAEVAKVTREFQQEFGVRFDSVPRESFP